MYLADSNGYHANACHQCIAMSYMGLKQYDKAGEYVKSVLSKEYAKTDINLMNQLNGLLEQIEQKMSGGSEETQKGESEQEGILSLTGDELDMNIDLDSKFGSYYMEQCSFAGLTDQKREQEDFEEKDIDKLVGTADKQKVRERAGYLQTAAYVEDKLNGKSSRYYQLLARSVDSWGNALQNNEDYDCSIACYVFAMENLTRVRSGYRDRNTWNRFQNRDRGGAFLCAPAKERHAACSEDGGRRDLRLYQACDGSGDGQARVRAA